MTKTTRKRIGRGILSLSVVTGLGAALVLASGIASSETIPMVVYKNPQCGCCTKWAEQLDKQGFTTEVRPVNNLNDIKREAGVPTGMNSCHTAKVAGYFVDGHVPAADIQRLLREKPDIAGLTAPVCPWVHREWRFPGVNRNTTRSTQ